MNIIRNILCDYENLIKTRFQIPLSNGDIIKFMFNPQDLPHLLGLQYLVDIPILFEYSQKRVRAIELFQRMSSDGEDAIDTDEFEKSVYFDEIFKGRIQYFSSEMILDIINARQIVRFDPFKIKNFSTKLEKIEYMFWKQYKGEDNNYGYFGIGFMASGKENDTNYPNTFFFRLDDEYINHQEVVLPYSIMKEDKQGVKTFEIYWDQVFQSLRRNKHYKHLMKTFGMEGGTIDIPSIKDSADSEAMKHYELLQLDALNRVYLPYMKKDFKWSNDEKRYVLRRICNEERALYPNEVKQLLNEYSQRHL